MIAIRERTFLERIWLRAGYVPLKHWHGPQPVFIGR